MCRIVGIEFNGQHNINYLLDKQEQIHVGDFVIVENSQGKLFAKAVSIYNRDSEITQEYKLVRKASRDDIEKKALKKCKGLVNKYELNMYILDANYTFDHNQLTFHFLANNRVDFRRLAKDLATIYKTRIELRQVGVRDKAKNVGGCGQCGMPICCSKFLKDFDSVSINMAKNQNIALNPNKINGVCGRLLCCLKYEDECYKECRKNLPNVGKKVETEAGIGKVTSVDILKESYKVLLDNNEVIDVMGSKIESN